MPKLLVYIALGFVLWTLWSSNVQPPGTIVGKEPIAFLPTDLGGQRTPESARGMLTISDSTGSTVATYYADDDGVLHQDPEQRKSGIFKAEYTPYSYLWDTGLDVGAIAAVDSEVRLGIRISPVRVFYDLAAPDVIVTESAIGLGVSLFPPKRSVGHWSHFGVGIWAIHDLDSGANAISLGISTSLR